MLPNYVVKLGWTFENSSLLYSYPFLSLDIISHLYIIIHEVYCTFGPEVLNKVDAIVLCVSYILNALLLVTVHLSLQTFVYPKKNRNSKAGAKAACQRRTVQQGHVTSSAASSTLVTTYLDRLAGKYTSQKLICTNEPSEL